MSLKNRLVKLERGAGAAQIWVPYEPMKAADVFARYGITELPARERDVNVGVMAALRLSSRLRADNAASCVWRWVQGPGGQMRCGVGTG